MITELAKALDQIAATPGVPCKAVPDLWDVQEGTESLKEAGERIEWAAAQCAACPALAACNDYVASFGRYAFTALAGVVAGRYFFGPAPVKGLAGLGRNGYYVEIERKAS